LDSRLFDGLTAHERLIAQDQVLQWLEDFAVKVESDIPSQLEMLRQTEERGSANTAVLAACYINMPSLASEQENRKWDAVYGYYRRFAQAYQKLLVVTLKPAAQPEPCAELPMIVARALYYLGRCAKWSFFRYQNAARGDWIGMHQLYELAERGGYAELTVQPWSTECETSCTAIYLRTLMLATLNCTGMTKKEIDLADQWLEEWSRLLPLQQQFERGRQLFYVNLAEDCGGRRIRDLEPASSCRYWDTEPIVRIIEQAKGKLPQDLKPGGFDGGENVDEVDYELLFGYLLSEWSCDYYVRQRRQFERDDVRKTAQAIHGIFNICQHVKNLMVFRDRGINNESNENLLEADDECKKWVVNEGPYGFGTIVNLEADTWLGVGKLVALDYERNKDMTVIGVIRSIKLLSDQKCLVGIDVISHTPIYALLRESEAVVPTVDHALEAFLMSTLTFDGMPPFPGLYLPRNEDRKIPATLIIPQFNFTAAGMYEIHMENRLCLVRLGVVLEKRDDWVRVELKVMRVKELTWNAIAKHLAETI
jgi:hypothetical protein